MWRDRILDAAKEKGITFKALALAAELTETTVNRILTGKSATPYLANALRLGEVVGLTPAQLFSETNALVGSKTFEELERENDTLRADNLNLRADLLKCEGIISDLEKQRDMLEIKLRYTERLLETHEHYQLLRKDNDK